jgi:catechol 2,3-dioxygenase-like lactoylglutathione lyase family enzyme
MRMRQIVFAVRDLAQGSARLAALLGLDAPYRDPGVAEFGLDNAVFVFGDQFIELVAPLREGTAAGRMLSRRGDGGYMLILQTDDFERERARFAALGVRTVWQAEHADIRAMHLHPKDIGGAIVSVDQPRPAAAWRWGGPGWRVADGRTGAQRVVGVTLEAADPPAMAARWAEVLGLAPPIRAGARCRLALDGGAIDFVEAGARGEGIAGFSLAVADLAAVLDAARAQGLAVEDGAVTAFGARIELRSVP